MLWAAITHVRLCSIHYVDASSNHRDGSNNNKNVVHVHGHETLVLLCLYESSFYDDCEI